MRKLVLPLVLIVACISAMSGAAQELEIATAVSMLEGPTVYKIRTEIAGLPR